MSQEYEGQNPLDIAAQAEKDLNSYSAKTGHDANPRANYGHGASDSTAESGIDQSVTQKFPGSTAEYGSKVSGAGDNREIPIEEGGDIQRGTGKTTKAGDFDQGAPGEGPEDVSRRLRNERGGDNDDDVVGT